MCCGLPPSVHLEQVTAGDGRVGIEGANAEAGIVWQQFTRVRFAVDFTHVRHCLLAAASLCSNWARGKASLILTMPHLVHSSLGPGRQMGQKWSGGKFKWEPKWSTSLGLPIGPRPKPQTILYIAPGTRLL